MRIYKVRIIDSAGRLHRFIKAASSARAVESLYWARFGVVRLMSVVGVGKDDPLPAGAGFRPASAWPRSGPAT
ncbi:hypothetical protein PGB34_09545 [Xenophilus arseniciresistens]|uniref:Uncharacterized protein n=1 Tax=Xenophilus arseniciresistens TaxID=1283306 RepID=A0AAE3NA92_9BURK|nr:hypothetical protein [Xenophilus arseniciresistens]MDA7416607.1 hypothetical protein [Xenophilus arseniciresistens]